MAKKTYIGVNNVAREVKKMYIGVDGIARKVKKAYIGDENGLAKLIYSTSYNISYNLEDVFYDDEEHSNLTQANAGDTVWVGCFWDSSTWGPAYAIIQSAVDGSIYLREELEDWSGEGFIDFEMPPYDIIVYLSTGNGCSSETYQVEKCTYDKNNVFIHKSSSSFKEPVEVGTKVSMSFYCRYLGNVTVTLTDASTGHVYETKTFKNVGRSDVEYSFLMPFSDVNIQLTYEGIDLVRSIWYIPIEEYSYYNGLSVNLEYLPGIPTSAQVGEEVDLTPWFGENSTNGYTVECIDFDYGAGDWVVGDGQGDLTFNMPSESIYVVTSGVPYIGEIPDEWDCDIDGHNWVETAYYPPTCVMIGERYYKCSACGEEMMEEIDGQEDLHVWGADGKCVECGFKKP